MFNIANDIFMKLKIRPSQFDWACFDELFAGRKEQYQKIT
jgi:hypothetical protein